MLYMQNMLYIPTFHIILVDIETFDCDIYVYLFDTIFTAMVTFIKINSVFNFASSEVYFVY